MKKTIVFDFDGVIHNTLHISYNINKELAPNSISLDDYKDFFNGNIYKNKVIVDNSDKFFPLQREVFKTLKIDENIKSELVKISEEFDLFIISSNTEEVLNIYLENNGISDMFIDVLGLETDKSKVDKFNLLIDKYKIGIDSFVFVTDTLGDILEANKLDIRTLAVDFGFHEKERLEKGNPLKIISSFEEILPAVENVFNVKSEIFRSQ